MQRFAWLTAAALVATAATAQGQASAGALSQRLIPDARSSGLGGAFTAIAAGPTAAWWNTGALGLNEQASVVAMPFSYRQLTSGIDDIWLYSAGASGGGPGYGFGFNLNYLDYGPSRDAMGMPTADESHEWTLNLGAGLDLSRFLFPSAAWIDWGIGAAWKEVHADFATGGLLDPAEFGTATGTGRDVDLGTLVVLRKSLRPSQDGSAGVALGARFGFVFLNALDHEIEFDNSVSDLMGQGYRIGIALEGAWRDPQRARNPLLEARLAFDTTDFTGKVADQTAAGTDEQSYGLEVTVFDLVSLRYAGRVTQFSDWTDRYGLGVGGDFGPRFGARFDVAALPPEGEWTYHYTLSGWARF